MKIGIIGAGNVGQALGSAFTRAGHQVTMSASTPQSAAEKAPQAGATPARSNTEAVEGADAVVLAIWFQNGEQIAREIAEAARGKVVIDVSNPFNATFDGLVTDGGPSAAERFAEWLPGAKVAKAFNTVFGSVQSNPTLPGLPADGLFATDDEDARRTVRELTESIGLRPVDAGRLSMARYLEALHFLHVSLNAAHGWGWNTAVKVVGAPIPEPAETRELARAGASR